MIIRFSEQLMKKFGKIIIKRKAEWKFWKKIWYRMDWRNSRVINVQEWFAKHAEDIKDEPIVKDLLQVLSAIDNNDIKAWMILKWVHRKLKYVGDTSSWGVPEKWQTPKETLTKRNVSYNGKRVSGFLGDCEDGSILMGSLMHLAKIPPEQWDIVCGGVKGGGHCWVLYTSDRNGLEYCLDWTYWYDKTPFSKRQTFSQLDNYYLIWFGFNSEYSWKTVKNPNKYFRKS